MSAQVEALDWITVLVWFATRPREGKTNNEWMRVMLADGHEDRARELETIEALLA